MKRIPLTVQLSLVLFLVLVIPCVALTTFSSHLITRSSEAEIAEAALKNIETSRRLTEMKMSTASSSMHQMAAYTDFSGLNGLRRFSAIRGNADNGLRVGKLQQELSKLIRANPLAISALFLLDGADYVISSDRGVVPLEDYPSMSWLRSVSAERRGIGGVWVPRTMKRASDSALRRGIGDDADIRVLSYIYSLNRLTTSTVGTLVINLLEREVFESLNANSMEDNRYGTMLLQAGGRVMSHPDPAVFLIQSRNLPNIAAILDAAQTVAEGYAFHDLNGVPCLYTWLRSDYLGWVYVSIHPWTRLHAQTQEVLRNVAGFTIVIVLFSTVLAVAISLRLFRPMRRLVRSLKEAGAVGQATERNELAFITSAFQDVRRQEAELSTLLERHEKAALNLALYNTLTGEHVSDAEYGLVRQAMPHPFYVVGMLTVDNYNAYRRATGSGLRNYHLLLISAKCEELLGGLCNARGIKYAGDRLAVVMNLDKAGRPEAAAGRLADGLEELRRAAAAILGHTVTIGLSSVVGLDGIWQAAVSANEAVMRRLKTGGDRVLPWQQEAPRRYYYPHDCAARILNYLDVGDMAFITRELESLAEALRRNDSVSHENIRYIYIQLVGDAVRCLAENNVNTAFLFSAHGNVYSAIASCDTLDEVTAFMGRFYRDIIEGGGRDVPRQRQFVNSVLQYLRANYRQDIDFEALAGEHGISYSYMRKMVRQITGKSLLSHLNQVRVERAKQLLADTGNSMTAVAQAVGYHNVQSLNRFFHKLEGITPGEYRAQASGK
ncbi:MAG: AraC family transcriptional regulator [Clostridia bacterium]|nr:AraC family transcriptional regulator [Clostridia bacterium]